MTATAGSVDARWFADRATAASWCHALLIQPGLEDAEAAAQDGDWATCLLSCLLTVEKLVFCERLLVGGVAVPREPELLLAAALGTGPVADGLRRMQALRSGAGPRVEEETALTALACLAEVDRYVRAKIPIDVLPMRTPEGFYPSLRVAAELERLRKAVGLGPFEWSWWANLS